MAILQLLTKRDWLTVNIAQGKVWSNVPFLKRTSQIHALPTLLYIIYTIIPLSTYMAMIEDCCPTVNEHYKTTQDDE